MEATGTIAPARDGARARGARRLLALAPDERLVKRVRAGSEEAFAVLYERHHRKLLSFCRHMLGSQHEAEDALQQTFVNAYRDMLGGEKDLRLRPWLYRIARNECLSMLRAGRPQVELSPEEPSLLGLAEEVAGRDDLRELLHDIAGLPTDQRAALVLAELHDNSHTEVAEILGCDPENVKSLVFQARSSLLKSREARQISCEEVRRQLSVLRGGSLRRSVIQRHLSGCDGCRLFREEVRRQRAAIAVILPVLPSGGLKLGAVGAVAAANASAASLAGGGSAAGVGAGAALKSAVAAVAVTTAVGGAGVEVARHHHAHERPPVPAAAKRAPASMRASPAPAKRARAHRVGRARGRVHARTHARGREGSRPTLGKDRIVPGRQRMERGPLGRGRPRTQRPVPKRTPRGGRRAPGLRPAKRGPSRRAPVQRERPQRPARDAAGGVVAPRSRPAFG
jgi:RNA polymerase sigma factor (sigma-70 family)